MRKHQTDKKIFIATFVLVLIGTIMVSIIGPSYTNIQNISYGKNDDPNTTIKSQILFVVLAFVAMMVLLKMPLRGSAERKERKKNSKFWSLFAGMFEHLPGLMMLFSLIVCTVMAVIPGAPFVRCALGGCRWLNLGVIQLQMAELVKFSAIFYFAKVCTECRNVGGFEGRKDVQTRATRGSINANTRMGNYVSSRMRGRVGLRTGYDTNGYLGGRSMKSAKNKSKNRGLARVLRPGTVLYVLLVEKKIDLQLIKRRVRDFCERKDGLAFWVKFLVPLVVAEYFIVVKQKDLGSGLPLAAIVLAMLLVSGVKIRVFAALTMFGVLFVVLSMLGSPHRVERLKTFFSGKVNSSETVNVREEKEKGKDAETYHIDNALIAIGSGGLFGVGIGNNVQTAGYLPESITDSMFAVIGETIGFVGILGVLFFYYMLLSRMLRVADCTKDSYYQLVTIGVFAWLAGHVVINIAAMTGLAPVTGIPLPLLSKGGTSLIMNMAIIGLVLNISQYTMRADILDAERRKLQ